MKLEISSSDVEDVEVVVLSGSRPSSAPGSRHDTSAPGAKKPTAGLKTPPPSLRAASASSPILSSSSEDEETRPPLERKKKKTASKQDRMKEETKKRLEKEEKEKEREERIKQQRNERAKQEVEERNRRELEKQKRLKEENAQKLREEQEREKKAAQEERIRRMLKENDEKLKFGGVASRRLHAKLSEANEAFKNNIMESSMEHYSQALDVINSDWAQLGYITSKETSVMVVVVKYQFARYSTPSFMVSCSRILSSGLARKLAW